MQVEIVQGTDDPERVACVAARGDYYDGFVAEDSFAEVMDGVSYEDRHVEAVQETIGETSEPMYRQYALLERLFRRGHWGPFEHPQITLAIEGVSRACMAQLTRHRHASFDVQSQRYVDFSEKEDPVAVPRSLTDPDHATRGAGEVDVEDREMWEESFELTVNELVDRYENMVEAGVPKEDARFVLPIGTKVNMTVSMNARTLLHIEDMRKKGDAQWEIRELTELVHERFAEWMPMTAQLYEEHGPNPIAP